MLPTDKYSSRSKDRISQASGIDKNIFTAKHVFFEEQQKIFKSAWVPICHESELPEPYDFRTASIANENILVARAPDNKVNAFLNVCPHRGMLIERRPQGSFLEGQASGNPKRITCMFHAWQFDMRGNCVYVAREKEGYQDRFSKNDAGLRRLRCEVKYGGFVWVNMNDQPQISLEQWIDSPFKHIIGAIEAEPLEVFNYHKSILRTNYKLNHEKLINFRDGFIRDANGSKVSGETPLKSAVRNFQYGHVVSGTFGDCSRDDEVLNLYSELLERAGDKENRLSQDEAESLIDTISQKIKSNVEKIGQLNSESSNGEPSAEALEQLSFPKMGPNQWFMVNLFPGFNFHLHGSVLSVSTITPLGPDEVLVEVRGLGVKSDTEAVRAKRVNDHNLIWGPFNLGNPTGHKNGGHEVEEIDEDALQQYYNEWGRIMGRMPTDLDEPFQSPSDNLSVPSVTEKNTLVAEQEMVKPAGLNIVVIGASHAGINFADKMRKSGFDGSITILDRQSGGPMERPPLSKAFLLETEDKASTAFLLRQKKWYKTQRINLKTKTNVQKINLDNKILLLDGGDEVDFDKLVIASGATPRNLQIAENIGNVFVLRQPADAVSIRQKANDAKRIIIIGGGYIGLEVAASLRKKGLEVDVIEVAERVLARVASAPAAKFLSDLHKNEGVSLYTGVGVDEILEKNGLFIGVKLTNGQTLSGDMLLVGIGVLPESKMANEAGLETQRDDGGGILVDEKMFTSHPDVLAIGDVALPRGHASTVESVHNAQETAAIAAAAIMGSALPKIQAPWFWSDQYDAKLQSVGIVPVDDKNVYQVTRPGKREGGVSFWSYRGSQLVAVEVFSDPATYMEAKQCLDTGRSPDPNLISNASFSPVGD